MAEKMIKDIKNEEMETIIKELKEFEILKKQAEERINELRNKVRTYMQDAGETEVAFGQYVCSLTEVNSVGFDKGLIQELAPDLYEKAVKPNSYVKLTIK